MSEKDKHIQEKAKELLIEHWNPLPLTLQEGRGCIVKDSRGKQYIDCTAQAWTLSTGHSHPRVIESVNRQIEKLSTAFFGATSTPKLKLAQKLMQITPPGFNKVMFDLSGSTAIEGAMHLAMRYTEGQDFVSFYHGYHGRTFATLALGYTYQSYVPAKRGLEKFIPKPIRVPSAYCYRCYFGQEYPGCELLCAQFAETALRHAADTKVAGVIIEPIQANGGHIVPPEGYLKKLRDICARHDVPLIFDEVQTGMGRCGKMFASQVFEVTPDIMVLGKGLGAGFPITAVLTSKKYAHLEKGEWGFTHAGSPFACAAALAAIDVIEEERLCENAEKVGSLLIRGLKELAKKYAVIGEVRGKGLMIGVELVKNRETKEPAVKEAIEVCERARKRGVIIGKSGMGPQGGNVLKIKPPLCINESQVEKVLEVLGEVFEDICK